MYIFTIEKILKIFGGYTGDVDPSAGHADPSKELFLSPTDDLTNNLVEMLQKDDYSLSILF